MPATAAGGPGASWRSGPESRDRANDERSGGRGTRFHRTRTPLRRLTLLFTHSVAAEAVSLTWVGDEKGYHNGASRFAAMPCPGTAMAPSSLAILHRLGWRGWLGDRPWPGASWRLRGTPGTAIVRARAYPHRRRPPADSPRARPGVAAPGAPYPLHWKNQRVDCLMRVLQRDPRLRPCTTTS